MLSEPDCRQISSATLPGWTVSLIEQDSRLCIRMREESRYYMQVSFSNPATSGLCVVLPSQTETRRGASESGSPERGGDTWGPAGSAEDDSHDAGRVSALHKSFITCRMRFACEMTLHQAGIWGFLCL